jgi:site-specific DNA-methyltransferase (adenine-specific)
MLTLLQGDASEQLQSLESKSVQCCVTSPPYWGLRDFDSQLGLEPTPEAYIANMVAVFREVWRVLRDDGTLWLNMGDSFLGKQLVAMPWRLALALQADGWYLRSDIIWHKPNPMPESVTDRPTKAHEYIFLLTKSERYLYDADAIREPYNPNSLDRYNYRLQNTAPQGRQSIGRKQPGETGAKIHEPNDLGRNKRSVWTIPTQPYAEAHFATFPEELPKLCILAGTKLGDTVLDPFAGSGTTGQVAIELGRKAILIELNPDYCEMIRIRCTTTIGML